MNALMKTIAWPVTGVTGLAVVLYMLLPWFATRVLHCRVLKKGPPSRIALTFDDGPHPEYTPKLLDLLARHGVKATFFVVGREAERHPEIIRRMHREGHCIGIHNYTHRSNWTMLPQTAKRNQAERAADAIEAITGVRPVYYRPPWGLLNAADLFMLREKYRFVMWSAMIGDWRRTDDAGAERLKRKLRRAITGGRIVLLHDSGETFGAWKKAPGYMLQALEEVLEEVLDERDAEVFARIDEADALLRGQPLRRVRWPKRAILRAWLAWERLFARLFRVKPVDPDNPFLKLRIREYYGKGVIPLRDGSKLLPGDRVAELHLDNELLLELGMNAKSAFQLTVGMIRRMEALLPKIARLLARDPAFRDVKALYGISLIHRGVEPFGFTVADMPRGLLRTLTRHYLRILMAVIHPQGRRRLGTRRDQLVPKIIAMSASEAVARYGGLKH